MNDRELPLRFDRENLDDWSERQITQHIDRLCTAIQDIEAQLVGRDHSDKEWRKQAQRAKWLKISQRRELQNELRRRRFDREEHVMGGDRDDPLVVLAAVVSEVIEPLMASGIELTEPQQLVINRARALARVQPRG